MPRIICMFVVAFALAFGASSALSQNDDRFANFSDPAGDVPGNIPDITGVTVSHDERGVITFVIWIPNRPTTDPDTAVQIDLDVDSLEDPRMQPSVLDRLLIVEDPSIATGVGFEVVNQGYFGIPQPEGWATFSWLNGTLVIRVDGRLLASSGFGDFADIPGRPGEFYALRFWPPERFSFRVSTLVWQEERRQYLLGDRAPQGDLWSYEVKILRDLILKEFRSPRTVKAGKSFTVSMAAVRDVDGQVATADPICKAKIGKKLLPRWNPPVAAGAARPSATCSWLVPKKIRGKTTKGKTIIGGLTLTDSTGLHPVVESKSFSVKVK